MSGGGVTGDTIRIKLIVLDTSSLVAAVRSPSGAAREVVALILRREVRLLLDYKLSLEYRDVVLRPEHIRKAQMTELIVTELIESLEELAEPVDVRHKIRPLSVDANDDMVLDVAINGRAEVIVTQNLKHFAVARRFGIAVLTPTELVEQVKGARSNGQ